MQRESSLHPRCHLRDATRRRVLTRGRHLASLTLHTRRAKLRECSRGREPEPGVTAPRHHSKNPGKKGRLGEEYEGGQSAGRGWDGEPRSPWGRAEGADVERSGGLGAAVKTPHAKKARFLGRPHSLTSPVHAAAHGCCRHDSWAKDDRLK